MREYADQNALRDTASGVVEMALGRGATTAVATVIQNSEFSVEVRHQEIENLSEAESHLVKLTVSKDSRRATVKTSDFSKSGLAEMADRTLAMCRYTDVDPFYTLPEREMLAKELKDLDLFDERVMTFTVEDKIAMALDLEQKTLAADSRLHSNGAAVSTLLSATALANSLGFVASENGSLVAISTGGFAEDPGIEGDLNTGRKQNGSWSSRARFLSGLEPVDQVAARAAHLVLRKLGCRKPKTGKFPVYFEPITARSIWGHLINSISGSAVFRKETYLVDRMGTEVGSPLLTMFDDPHIPRGLASTCFDNEGIATLPRTLIEHGVLNTYLLSTYSANKLGLRSTGHAGGTGNLLIQPGTLSEDEMLRRMGTGVWVTSLFGSGVNETTGDYSRGAFGLWVENGEVAYPIVEFTLNSHLDRMYKNITMVGNNRHEGWSTRTPGVVIGEMTVSGE